MPITNHRDGKYMNHEENKTKFTVHRNNKSPMTNHENASLCPSMRTDLDVLNTNVECPCPVSKE
jgi:hypothetical protein